MITAEFVTAGKATFTVESVTGHYYTYRITHKEANGNFSESWLISLLTGPDNTSSYTYLGKLNPSTGAVTLTAGSKFTDNSTPVRVIRWALQIIWGYKELPAGYNIHHEGRCGRCNRLLTVPSSIEGGIGPECAKAIG